MRSIDSWIIDRVEYVAGKFQQYTGLNCFMVSRIFLGIVLLLIAYRIVWLGESTPQNWIGIAIFGLSFSFYWLDDDHRAVESASVRVGNPNRYLVFLVAMRLMTALSAMVSVIAIIAFGFTARSIQTIAFMAHIYLEACTPLPPCKGRIRESISGYFLNPVRVEVAE